MDFTVNRSVTSAMLTTSSLNVILHVSVICCDTTKNTEDIECEQCATSIPQVKRT